MKWLKEAGEAKKIKNIFGFWEEITGKLLFQILSMKWNMGKIWINKRKFKDF